MPINRPKPLFKVASEFNVSTQSIVDTLEDKGLTASNRPNFKITPDMYVVLEQVYGEDKAKSADHERAKEAYESRRNQMMNQRNESVTVDQFLEPLEKEEVVVNAPATTIEDDLLGELEPIDKSTDTIKKETKEVSNFPERQEIEKVDQEKESHSEVEDINSAETSVTSNLESFQRKEQNNATELEMQVPKIKTKSTKSSTKAPSEPIDEQIDDKSQLDAVTKKPAQKEKSEEFILENEIIPNAETEEDIIRGRASKLKGTKVLGKGAFTSEKSSDKQPRKKRKRKKDLPNTSSVNQEESITKSTVNTKKKSKKKVKKTEVDEIDVDRMMKETLKKFRVDLPLEINVVREEGSEKKKEKRNYNNSKN